MRKELMNMVKLSDHDKTLKLNGAFELRARFTDEFGVNVELSHKTPVSVAVDLVSTMGHDKFLFRSMPIKARDADEMQTEIAEKMAQMFCEFGEELAKQMNAGYLP